MFTVIGRTYERHGPAREGAAAARAGAGDRPRARSDREHVARRAEPQRSRRAPARPSATSAAAEPLLDREPRDAPAAARQRRQRRRGDAGRTRARAEGPRPRRRIGGRRSARRWRSARRSSATSTARRRPARASWRCCCCERGDLAGAEPLFRENVATSQRVLGADHPNVAAAKANLAQAAARARTMRAAAEALLRDSRRRSIDRVLGDAHPQYASYAQRLATAVEVQGRLDEAQALFDQAVLARARSTWQTTTRGWPR